MKLDVKTGGAVIKFNVNFKEVNQKLNVDFGQYTGGTVDADPYEGEYNVTPSFKTAELATKGKVLTDNVTVEAISVNKISNTAGGSTVIIGG